MEDKRLVEAFEFVSELSEETQKRVMELAGNSGDSDERTLSDMIFLSLSFSE